MAALLFLEVTLLTGGALSLWTMLGASFALSIARLPSRDGSRAPRDASGDAKAAGWFPGPLGVPDASNSLVDPRIPEYLAARPGMGALRPWGPGA